MSVSLNPQLPAGPSTRFRIVPSISEGVLIAGLLALVIPTLLTMARSSWTTEAGAHGPIVLATGLWLLWRDRSAFDLRTGRAPFSAVLAGLAVALPVYVAGRITGIMMLETLSLFAILLLVAWGRYGTATLRRLWFPIVYLLFLVTPPENWVFVATRPLKTTLSDAAVQVLSWTGLAVGSTGTMIQIEGFQLRVATACSGINSLIGISAISLFYVYLRHGSAPRYAALLTVLVLPIALLTNFLRILLLVLTTLWFGEDVAQGAAHEAAGLVMFTVALVLFLGLDAVLHPLCRRLGWTQ